MTNAILGAYSYAEFGLCCLAFTPVMGVAKLLHRSDPTQRVPGRWMRRLGRLTTNLSPLWKFSVVGERPADIDRRAYVVVSNHESTADPFLLSFLPWDMRWVGKEELYKNPVVGHLFRWGGDIQLRRGDRASVIDMMRECRVTLAGGVSVMLFPEGTRSPDGRLLPFKPGAFDLAIAAGAPILPIAISGTRDCRPKGSNWFGKARASATILEPIETTGLTAADVPALAERVRGRISEALGKSMEPRPAPAPRAAHVDSGELMTIGL